LLEERRETLNVVFVEFVAEGFTLLPTFRL